MPLAKYILKHYGGNQSEFARANGFYKQEVSLWVKKGFIVINHRLYCPKRKLQLIVL